MWKRETVTWWVEEDNLVIGAPEKSALEGLIDLCVTKWWPERMTTGAKSCLCSDTAKEH